MKINFPPKSRVKRIILYSALACASLLLLVTALILSAPAIVSAPAMQSFIRHSMERSLHRPVSWRSLEVSWSRGLAVSGLNLGEGPPPLLRCSIDRIAAMPVVSLGKGRRPELELTLAVGGVDASLAPGPPAPPKPYREPLTALAEAIARFEAMDWPLPGEISVKADIDPVRVSYRDPASGRQLTLSDFSLDLEMPSLARMPIEAGMRGILAVDGRSLDPLRLTARVTGLVTPKRRIRPASAILDLDASMPGTTLKVRGGMKERAGFSASALLDLQRLATAAGPMIGPSTPVPEGKMDIDLKAGTTSSGDLRATLAIKGSRLAAAGGRLGKRSVGPLELRLGQRMVSDHERMQVRFEDGSLAVAGLADAQWRATVDRPDRPDRSMEMELEKLRLDLKRTIALVAPFLPPGLRVGEIEGELSLARLRAAINGKKSRGEVAMEGFAVKLPRLRLSTAKGEIDTDGVELSMARVAIPLAAMRPTRVDATLSYGIRRASISGASPVTAEGLRGDLLLALSGLDLKSASPRKFTADAEVSQSLDIGRLALGNGTTAEDIHEESKLRARAGENGEIEASLPGLKLSVKALQGSASGRKLRPVPLNATLTADRIRLPAGKGAKPSLDHADCAITAGDMLQLKANAGITAASRQIVSTGGRASLDLDRLLPFVSPFLPKGVEAGGNAAITWNLAAPLAATPLPKGDNPLRLAKAASEMIDHGEITLSLDNREIAAPLKKGRVTMARLRTPSPLRLSLPGRGGKIILDGGIGFEGVAGLSGSAGQLPPQKGSLSFRGEIADWKSIRMKEELRLDSLGLSQTADATVGGIEPLLEGNGKPDAGALIRHLDADISTRVDAVFPHIPNTLTGGIELSGKGSASLRANLSAGHELRIRANLETQGLGVGLKNGARVEGVGADILIDRTFALARGNGASWTPLSRSLVHPLPEQGGTAGSAGIAGRLREDLRGREGGGRRFTVRRVSYRFGETPLELTSLEGDLLLNREEVGLGFFQTELLGGTLRARGVIDLTKDIPAASVSCSFSNLETALLTPGKGGMKSAGGRHDTEISGEFALDAPLVAGERQLLEGARMRLNLRKIGPETLERALFSLDPYERNEQIVAQRKMLRNGTLKWLRAETLDGAFSLEGEVRVKGFDLNLPRVERVRLSDMAIGKRMAGIVAAVKNLRRVLDLVAADTIIIGPKGEVSLVRSDR